MSDFEELKIRDGRLMQTNTDQILDLYSCDGFVNNTSMLNDTLDALTGR